MSGEAAELLKDLIQAALREGGKRAFKSGVSSIRSRLSKSDPPKKKFKATKGDATPSRKRKGVSSKDPVKRRKRGSAKRPSAVTAKRIKFAHPSDSSHLELRSTPHPMAKARGRSKRPRRSRRLRKKRKRRHLQCSMPKTKLVKLCSYHHVTLTGAEGVASFVQVNTNNPLDPLTVFASKSAIVSTEHHPKYWDVWENLYEKYEVLSTKVSCTFIAQNNNSPHSNFIIRASHAGQNELKTILDSDTDGTGMIRLKESYGKDAIIKFMTTTSAESGMVKLFHKTHHRHLEGLKDKHDPVLQGTTQASATQATAARSPVMFVGHQALGTDITFGVHPCILKIEYIILFTAPVGHVQGVTIA